MDCYSVTHTSQFFSYLEARAGLVAGLPHTTKPYNTILHDVMSRYMEDLSWVDDLFYSEDIIIYNKGSPLKGTTPLQNIGRDFHSYFFHIAENFSTLVDITIFVPGSTFDGTQKRARILRVLEILRRTRNSVILCSPLKVDIGLTLKDFQISTYMATNAQIKKANPEDYLMPAAHRPFGN